MTRAASLLVVIPTIMAIMLVGIFLGELELAGASFGIIAIICFAILATGWTVDRDT